MIVEHHHRWAQSGPEEVYCLICGLEPHQQDQLDVQCEMERRLIRRRHRDARARLGLASDHDGVATIGAMFRQAGALQAPTTLDDDQGSADDAI